MPAAFDGQRAEGEPEAPSQQSPLEAGCPWPTSASRAGLEAAPSQRSCRSILNAISPI